MANELIDLVMQVYQSPGYADDLAPLPSKEDTLASLLKDSTILQIQKALYLAVQMNDIDLAEKLVAKGANPAAKYGIAGAVESLLDVKANNGSALSDDMKKFLQKNGAQPSAAKPAPTVKPA